MRPEEFASKLSPDLIKRQAERLMSRVVATVEANSKKETPVRTGNLRRSETGRVLNSGERGVVGTAVNYAPYVHARVPFFERGLAASRDTIDDLLADSGRAIIADMT